ncbi:MAG TPA: fibronectin type III domain-containing protein [Blastocatellia bacterium]|nr:fibronectin type III domain-containing protein [Blastocatellia bacterium]
MGSPVAPARLTERTSNLSAIQRGSNIQLSWPAPTLVQNESSRLYISRVDIFRLTERRDEEPILDPDDYETAAQVVGFMDRAAIEAQSKTLGHLQFTDAINLTNSRDLSNARLRYAIRYANGRDQFAALSNTVAVEPTPGIALPPTELRVNAQQDAVILSWNPPSANIDGSSPASVVGYNVYRRSARRDTNDSPLNGEPVAATTFTDARFQYLTEYVYSVRALSQGATGLVESADSEPLPYTPVDTFQPSAPDPVSIASANGTISLFWPTSSERDVIGYNIYRANSPDAQSDAWTRLNEQPVSTVTYRDERVVVDQAYSYRVTAIDRFNNESQPSRVVTETAHP